MMFVNPRNNRIFLLSLLYVGLGMLCAAGCRTLPNSGLDPYGERLFESCPLDNIWPSNCFSNRQSGTNTTPQPVVSTTTPQPVTTQGAAVYQNTPDTVGTLPGGLGGGQSGPVVLPNYGSTATAMGIGVRGIDSAIIASPDGEPRLAFEDTGGYALPTAPVEGPALVMTPREQIAPIGSEVVLISSYLGSRDHLVTNEKIEWTLEGVGSIQKFDAGSCCDPLFFDYVRAKKITDRYAVTKTSQVFQTLDRGTPETTDDLHLLRGQTWISVNSMKEGTTHVSAFAPSLKDWSKRTDVGIIHWVDALWVLPRLSMAPVGESRGLTTTLLRATNGQPRRGWIIRYEILNGPPAGFGPGYAQIEEVETDLSGQASVILYPKEHQTGTCTIGVSIIRPAGVDGSDRRVTVGRETVRQTWAGSSNVFIDLKAPTDGKIGQDLPHTMTVTNRSASWVRGVVALDIPPMASCTASNPPAQQQNMTLLWDVDVAPQSNTAITFSLKYSAVGAPILTPKFYPQGTTPITPSISGTSVPPPASSGSVGIVQPTPPPPTTPGATTFHGSSTSPTTPSATGTGATTFQGSGTRRNLGQKLSIEIITPRVELNKPVDFTFRVTNNGTTAIQNAKLVVEVPREYHATVRADFSTGIDQGQDGQGNAVLYPSPIPPRGSAYITVTFPTTSLTGHKLVGRFYIKETVGGNVQETLIDQTETQVSPR